MTFFGQLTGFASGCVASNAFSFSQISSSQLIYFCLVKRYFHTCDKEEEGDSFYKNGMAQAMSSLQQNHTLI